MSSAYIPAVLRRRLHLESDSRCAYCRSSEIYKETVPLVNPRSQHWREHFMWSRDGIEIIGITPCGRATVEALRLNNENVVTARYVWTKVGFHPPIE
jgi:hypothetical protein